MIVLHIRTGEVEHMLETVADSLDDLTIPLELWNKYFRKRVQAKFDAGGPGWEPKKGSTGAGKAALPEEAVKQLADQMLRRKLKNELRRATRKYARGSGSAKAMERRLAVIAEFERIAAGGLPVATLAADKKLEKSVRGLRERHARATTKAQGKPLGRMASSIKSKLTKFSVTVYSEVPFSAVHNDGGTAGHGAKIPERKFLDIDDDDLKVLVQLIEDGTRFNV